MPRAGHLDRGVRKDLDRRRHQRRRQRSQEEPFRLRPAHTGIPAAVREDHRRDAGQMPDGMVADLRRALGRRGQQGGLRAGPLPGGVQRPRHQRRAQGLSGHHHPEGTASHRRSRRHPGDGRARAQRLPRSAEPVPLPRRDQAVAAVRRRDRARRHSTRRSSPAGSTSSTTSPTSCPRCSRWR